MRPKAELTTKDTKLHEVRAVCFLREPSCPWCLFAFRRHQQCYRVRHDADLRRQRSQQFTVGFDEDARAWSRATKRPAFHFHAVDQVDSGYLPMRSHQASKDVTQIRQTATGAKEHQA